MLQKITIRTLPVLEPIDEIQLVTHIVIMKQYHASRYFPLGSRKIY